MLADGLTQVLHRPTLFDMRDKLHLVDVGPQPRESCGGVSSGTARMHMHLRCTSGIGVKIQVSMTSCCGLLQYLVFYVIAYY